MNDTRINDFLNGRLPAVLAAVLLAVSAVVAVMLAEVPPVDMGNGIFFDVSKMSLLSTHLSMPLNVALIVVTGLIMLLLNKLYNFVKALTFIGTTTFFLLEMALPVSSSALNMGTMLCLTLSLGALILFGTYENKFAQRPIFLVMCLLSFGAMFNWAFVALIVAFALGFAYMRAMNWKSFLAILIGLFTPFWIAMGLGWVSPADFKPIEINAVWATIDVGQLRSMIVWTVAVIVATIALSAVNLFSIYSYRLQLRVYNAFFLLVTMVSIVGMCVDYRDMFNYVPMLNLCLAVQVAHAFTISTFPKRYVFMFVIVAATLAAYTCNLLL